MNLRMPIWTRSLQARIGVLLFSGVLLAGLAFYALLLTLTRQRLLDELDVRSRGFATLLSSRLATPLLLRDREDLRRELMRATQQHDVVAVAVYDDRGTQVDRVVMDPSQWVPESSMGGERKRDTYGIEVRMLEKMHLREVEAPIHREREDRLAAMAESGEVFGQVADTVLTRKPSGWVRVLYTTRPVDQAVGSASRVGFTIMFTAFALWLIPLFSLLRLIARPLREASDLARAIAQGQLERRIPVRSNDELGTLAESLNTMASALTDAQRLAREEGEAMRLASEAMVAIAQGAREAQGADDVFGVVAEQLRRVTASAGAALCVPDVDQAVSTFTRFSPPLPWGELDAGLVLESDLARRLDAMPTDPFRLDLDRDDSSLARGLRRDGFRVALMVPLGDQPGRSAALMLVSRDPAAFPPIQVELVHSLASHLGAALGAAFLHGRLQSAVAELEETRERLERSERMRVAGEMASGVAHDFNNVLGAILGRAQLVRRRAQSGQLAGEELDRALEIIERAAQDGGDTVRRLRQFGSGGRESGSEVVDLDVAIRDAAEYTRPRWENEAQAMGRQIRVEIDSRPGATIEGRASELREVFTNLILNSMDALPAGGTIRLATEVTPDRVTARIEDDGVGMSADVQQRIFDPFFTTKGEGGTGLGLSIVYGIVQAASGRIAVDSAPGRGSRMTLDFPHAAPGLAEIRPHPGEPNTSAALRIMVVDDEPAVRDLLIDILRSLGHSPQGFDSGTAAFDAYSTGTYDLVFTDLGMPGMTGWDLATAIRRRDAQVPIALITGWGAEVGPEALDSAGADAVVSKPFTIEDIEGLCTLARDRGRRAA